jgi:hypothetical protein
LLFCKLILLQSGRIDAEHVGIPRAYVEAAGVPGMKAGSLDRQFAFTGIRGMPLMRRMPNFRPFE